MIYQIIFNSIFLSSNLTANNSTAILYLSSYNNYKTNKEGLIMRNKNVKCNACGSQNWSGALYCEKCSGDLYHNHNDEKIAAKLEQINNTFKLWE